MEYQQFIKKLALPADFIPPATLTHDTVVVNAITRADLSEDVAGINSSMDLIKRTRGGRWPSEPVTEDFNYVDLVWHELEFRDGTSFTYVVRDRIGGYLGCCYLYPMGVRAPLTEELAKYDVDVSWWVTPQAYDQGLYRTLYFGLKHWVTHDYPFTAPYYSNVEIPA